MNADSRPPEARGVRGRALAVVVAITALVLSACGAKIDTVLTLDTAGAGSRTMTLTLASAPADLENVHGGIAAIDASIQAHLPAEIEYSGITDDGTTATAVFTVSFGSLTEYTDKAKALLTAGDLTWDPAQDFIVEDSLFITGVRVSESFTSADLLQWLSNGLIADGVVDEENRSNVWTTGTTTVSFNGVTYNSYLPISFSEVDDNGFTSVSLTTLLNGGAFERTITYWLDSKAQYTSSQAMYDEYFSALEAGGMEVVPDDSMGGMYWEVSFSAADSTGLVTLTNTALSSEESAFAMTSEPSADDPLAMRTVVTEFLECSAICSPDIWWIDDVLTIPGGYSDGSDVISMISIDGEEQSAEFTSSVTLQSARVELDLSGGDVTWTGHFSLADDDAAVVGDGLAAALRGGTEAEVQTESADGALTYTVTVSGSDPYEFSTAYTAWADTYGDVSLMDYPDNSLFKRSYLLSAYLPLSNVLGSSSWEMPLDVTITLPGGESIAVSDSFNPAIMTADGSTVTFSAMGDISVQFEVTGTPLSAWLIYGGIALVLLGGALALFLSRKKIAAAAARRREAAAQQQAAMAEQHAEQYAAAQQTGAAPQSGAAPGAEQYPVPHAPAQDVFRPEIEADYL